MPDAALGLALLLAAAPAPSLATAQDELQGPGEATKLAEIEGSSQIIVTGRRLNLWGRPSPRPKA